ASLCLGLFALVCWDALFSPLETDGNGGKSHPENPVTEGRGRVGGSQVSDHETIIQGGHDNQNEHGQRPEKGNRVISTGSDNAGAPCDSPRDGNDEATSPPPPATYLCAPLWGEALVSPANPRRGSDELLPPP
ncbi:unnamed protein product, partial [Discosporangium mesarthrocarpum]